MRDGEMGTVRAQGWGCRQMSAVGVLPLTWACGGMGGAGGSERQGRCA